MTAHANGSDEIVPILEVSGLGVDFWVGDEWIPAAVDLDYKVNPGEVLAIVGESGSGKSVSSMSLLGLLPKNGRVRGARSSRASRWSAPTRRRSGRRAATTSP